MGNNIYECGFNREIRHEYVNPGGWTLIDFAWNSLRDLKKLRFLFQLVFHKSEETSVKAESWSSLGSLAAPYGVKTSTYKNSVLLLPQRHKQLGTLALHTHHPLGSPNWALPRPNGSLPAPRYYSAYDVPTRRREDIVWHRRHALFRHISFWYKLLWNLDSSFMFTQLTMPWRTLAVDLH